MPPTHPDVLYDFCDGEIYQNNPVFSDSVIRLHLYVDEFELCDAIGPKRGKYKVTAVYYSIGNFSKRYRHGNSTIFCVYLPDTLLSKSLIQLIKKILQPLIADLQTLHQGIELNVNGENKVVKAVLTSIAGDNLSSLSLAGFQTHFNAGRICRNCNIDYTQFRDNLLVDNLRLRNSEVYSYQLQSALECPEDGKIYGVLRGCAFSKLDYFCVTKAFPPDVMHDCLEGIIPLTVKLVLTELFVGDLVTVSGLNKALKRVKIPTSDKPNKLPESFFRGNSKIVGTAAQKRELFIILPQIVNIDTVTDNPAWNVYLMLRDCMDYIMSPVVVKEAMPFLTGLIQSYLHLFKETFGADNLIPKHHFMLHYPSMMTKFGPLRNLWCMRYEAQHQYFKKINKQHPVFQKCDLYIESEASDETSSPIEFNILPVLGF